MTDIRTRLVNEADAAFDRYLSAVRTGGTPAQRQWAWDQYVTAETKVLKLDFAASRPNTRTAKAT